MPVLNAMPLVAHGLLRGYLTSRLAMDAKVDLSPVVAGITTANAKANRKMIAAAVRKAVAGKLAQDADVEDIEEVIEQLAEMAPQVAEAAASGEAAEGNVVEDEGEPISPEAMAFLKSKLSDEDLAMFESMMDDEPVVEDEAPAMKPGETKDMVGKPAMVSKPAMDAAIAKASHEAARNAEKAVMARMRGIQKAEADVAPYVGKLNLALDGECDSASAVYKLALDQMGVDLDGVPAEGYGAILRALPVPSGKANKTVVAMDSKDLKGFNQRFPGAATLKHR